MASRPYFVKAKGWWYVKWKGPGGKWRPEKLCRHPGWSKGQRPPKRPPPEAVRMAQAWRDREEALRRGVDAGDVGPISLRAFLDSHVLTAGAGLTEGSLVILRRVAAAFISWCAGRKITTVAGVTTQACREWLAERSKAPGRRGGTVAYKTLKTERGALSPAWSQAFQDGRVAVNPWLRAPVPGKPRTEKPPWWSEAEVARIAAACQPWLADVVIVGAYSGLRITSLLGLEWRDVDFETGTIHVRASASKTGVAYTAPMLGPARDVLERRRFVGGGTLVFAGPKLGKKVPATRTYDAIKRAVGRSGVPDRGTYNHALRHSFATWAVNRGVPLAVVSSWLGHSTIAQTMRYSHSDPAEVNRWATFFEGKRDDGLGGT